ncbi:MAG: L-arabinose transport system permease protein AraP [Lentisphaerae bacterium ADurb.Bin242]|nr:MAG: L-arabinose transport system permease protein AraP [Lentisphaerae bacterium ADurb.Bin242]
MRKKNQKIQAFLRFTGRLKTVWTVLLLACVLTPLDMRAAEPEQPLKIPLRVQVLPDPESTTPDTRVRLKMLEAFKKQYPEIELSQFSGISIQNIGMESRLMLAIAGGAAPDVFELNLRMSDTYIQQNFLYPLDEFIRNDPEYRSVSDYLKTLLPAIRPAIYRDGPAIPPFKAGKHVWGLNGIISARTMMWRKDLFQDAGLDPDKPPETWAELLACAKKLSDPGRNRYGVNVLDGPQGSWDFMPFIWGAGGDIVTLDENGVWRASFGTREAAVALEFYIRLIAEKWVDSDGIVQRGYTTANADARSVTEAVKSGRVGIFFDYLRDKTAGGGTDPELIGIAPFPVGPAGKNATEINAGIEGIFAGIEGRKNSDGVYVPAGKIREAAWKYLRFMNNRTARAVYAKTMVEEGMGRQLSPALLREFGYTEYLKYFPKNWEDTFQRVLRDGKPEPYGKNCQMVYVYLTRPLDEARQLAREGKLPEGDSPGAVEKRIEIFQALLKAAEDRTNARMIGHIPAAEMKKRTTVAGIAAILILGVFSFVIWNIWKVFSPKDSYSGKNKGWEFRKNKLGYLIMLPAVLSILIWVYIPMVSGSQIFFQEYRVVGNSSWTGLDNLAGVLFSDEWWSAVWNTLRYMILILSIGFLAPILLAVLLQEVSHGKIIYRTLFYLPAVMSGLVVIFLWKLFYQSGSSGILNQMLGDFLGLFGIGFQPVAWLEDAKWAMLACVIPTIWASAGPGCLIYLAALKGVPEETYEAAEIDGANFFQKIWHVTLPTLKSLIIINFVGAFIAASQSGGMILVMTFGRAETEVAELHIFKEAYTNLRFGSAIAMAWVLGTITLLFTIYNLKRLSKMEFKTTGGK